ncbi:Na(+)-translocating NADH-quinone reductase subunit A [Thalassoroseus pseudoceratinae]|uniref:Na(+)-translocating NADH-quinone reductase subunit A n=1 Tax=Thalassoroseus pseudoceratinae TaxID=2713176 RepID=UPI00142039B0|nr:Na(+)-translocating NADH-quinone reductase subunit A [Thalassoroseus pseudoceratinae]
MIKIRKGFDIPLAGEPAQTVEDGPPVTTVGLLGDDYIGMRPTILVQEGESVKKGQSLFEDKKTPGVLFTAPVAGTVKAIQRGAKRKFESFVLEVGGDDEVEFASYYDTDLDGLSRDAVRENLVKSGLWTAFRTRPFSKVPALNSVPHSIFVTAIDTNPLAVRPEVVIKEHELDFSYGLKVIRHLTDGKVYLCKEPDSELPAVSSPSVETVDFAGPHPAGLPGTHIHFLDPVSLAKTVWHLNYQDVIAIGKLFTTGRLFTERVVSLAGPMVERPRLVRTVLGASLEDLTAGQLKSGDVRVVSGSVLAGREYASPHEFLGRYHLQVCALSEGRERELFGWQKPGFQTVSTTRAFASGFVGRGNRYALTTSQGGSPRAMVPIASYDRVMPLDIVPVYLLRSLVIGDTEQAQALGCLELDEEDLGLCTFVCPGKYEYGPALRDNLTTIEKEG